MSISPNYGSMMPQSTTGGCTPYTPSTITNMTNTDDLVNNAFKKYCENALNSSNTVDNRTKTKVNVDYSNWNIIGKSEFKKKVRRVFETVSSCLTNTLGPYGSTTIIEKYGEMHITKDGWQVLKNIYSNNQLENNIINLLIRISSQVVLKVGDGSTSSIVAANAILKSIEKDNELLKSIRPKDFMDILNECVEEITNRIYNDSIKVDNNYNAIYEMAYISTNGDSEIASIIKNIYETTHNPTIEFIKAKDDLTKYEVIEGYKYDRMTYIDSIFATHDDGKCVMSNPMILMFNHKVDIEDSLPIIGEAAMKAADSGRRLLVIAPNYDKFLLEYIKKNVTIEYKTAGISTVVYVRVPLVNNLSHDLYNDFSVMTGGEIITERYDGEDKFDLKDLDRYIGSCTEAIITGTDTLIKGFTNRNEKMYNKIVQDATNKYKELEDKYKDLGLVDLKLTELKNRMARLRSSMGIIYVGGYSSLEKTANYDLVEDAVKACESAYMYGYNIGENLIIPYEIKNILKEKKNELSGSEIKVYQCLYNAFGNVFGLILKNKYDDIEYDKIVQLFDKCLSNESDPVAYDLITDTFSSEIINSCVTDIEILKASASIIALLVSSNQYITITREK